MTLSVEKKFQKATEYVQGLPKDGPYQPDQDTKLKYYSYYKQATEGDVPDNQPSPGIFDFVGKAKLDAWKKNKGISKEDAQKEYVKLLVADLERTKAKSEELEQLLKELKE